MSRHIQRYRTSKALDNIASQLLPEEDDFTKKLRKIAADPTIVKEGKYTRKAFYEQEGKLTKNKENFLVVNEEKKIYECPIRKEDHAAVNLNALLEAASLLVSPVSSEELNEVHISARIDGRGKLKSLFLDVFTQVDIF